MKKWYKILPLLLVISLGALNAYGENYSENELKAVFYSKISKFIRWKENTSTITLCTVGDSKDAKGSTVAHVLNTLIQNKKPPYSVLENITMKDLDKCQMVYVGQDAEHNLQDILFLSQKYSIVTLSDIPSFTRRGGMFAFVRNNQGRFSVELNYDNAQKSGININASLLELIKVIK